MNDAAPHILVIRRRYLGDLVLLGPVLHSLRSHWPQAHIAVLTESAYTGVLAINSDVNETLNFPHGVGDWWALWQSLRATKFTHVFDFDNREKTALITWASGASQRFTLHNGMSATWGWIYSAIALVPVDFLIGRHVTTYFSRLLAIANVPVSTNFTGLTPMPQDVAAISQLPAISVLPHDRPRLLVHPGSRSEFRLWPAENFASVLDTIVAQNIASVTLIAGANEQHLVDAIAQRMTQVVARIDESLSVPQLAALLAQFDVLLCHDSGPMHVAAAVGTRVVALFGAQGSVVFAPLGEGHSLLSPPIPCVNCVSPETCVKGDTYRMRCVQNISPGEVVTALSEILANPHLSR